MKPFNHGSQYVIGYNASNAEDVGEITPLLMEIVWLSYIQKKILMSQIIGIFPSVKPNSPELSFAYIN